MRRTVLIAALTCASALAVANHQPAARTQSLPATNPQHLKSRPHARLRATHRASAVELAARNRAAQLEAKKLAALGGAGALRGQRAVRPNAVSVAAGNWVSLGPTDALSEFNGSDIQGVDSGRPNSIVVDPRDGNIVYMAVSGGGVWKTFDFLSGAPTWSPLTDTLPNLAIGTLAMDPANPDTLYLGSGDAFDAGGNTVQKSTDGGATWSEPVALSGTYPAPNGFQADVGDIRALGVRGNLVLAGTNVGLFSSTDGGATFALVDLPNAHSKVLTESIWSVVHLGNGQWIASGVTGCDETTGPPSVYGGADPGTACPEGNNGVLWRSTDAKTWTQVTTTPAATGIGRLTLAAGDTKDPAKTVVYAYVGSVDGQKTLGFWRSKDGGATWADATGALANPTFQYPSGPGTFDADCLDIDMGHGQTWYNQAIVVDPTNADHVLVGGNLCGARTLNGTADSPKWELVSHWLPSGGGGTTKNGTLKYVHADWHTATSVVINGAVRTFAGTDGGIFSSTNVFSPTTQAEKVDWTNQNRGLATHLMYSVASGDPVNANPFVLFAGLQDNGTRYRSQPATPWAFNQPVGGDGIGATVHVSTKSGTIYWASVEFGRYYCMPSANIDCSAGFMWTNLKALPDADELDGGGEDEDHRPTRTPNGDDAEPFFVRYANVETDTDGQSVLTNSNGQVFVSVLQADGTLKWVNISQDLTAGCNVTPPTTPPPYCGTGFTNVAASRTIKGLYGATGLVSRAPFFYTTTGDVLPTGAPTPWTVTKPVFPTGTTARLTGASSMDFPPVTPTGKKPGDVFIGAFTGIMNNGQPVPDDKGHLWRTTDAGQTWTSIVGADPAHRLPNVPIHVIKYDPVTPTTIYAGTDVGVYVSTDDGATWDRFGQGLPIVPVRDMYVAKNQEFIRVATYGRGLWEIYPSATANHGADGNGDYDRNLQIDWSDLASLSARLGTTPATTTAPLYSWIEDLTGGGGDAPAQLIDDADLNALLAKFGDHP
jgi:hypothetical protein